MTFTKKAATEMKDRAAQLLDGRSAGLTVCTFHALGYRFLSENQVRVTADGRVNVMAIKSQRSLVGEVIEKADPEGWFDIDTALRAISQVKNGITNDCRSPCPERQAALARIVTNYENALEEQQLVDFDDLLSLPLKMLRQSRRLREFYRRRWPYILIDEYQDTNEIQHQLIRMLTGTAQNLCVVGDDDQSIYGFRGATTARILGFQAEFLGATRITLDQSYRSHKEILDVANAVIQGASARHQKSLHSLLGNGGVVARTQADDAEQECAGIADAIQRRKACPGTRWADMAVLYRVQSDSHTLRNMLKAREIPYHSAVPKDKADDRVSVMTLHRSKGLEFPTVFLPAIEEDTIPHFHAVTTGQSGIEEERRLLYVGVTRAKKELILSTCHERRGRPRQVSRFLSEIGLG